MTATQPYIAITRRALDLEDYINVARRHSGWILGPLYLGTVISIVVGCSLQNVYQAQATMQIRPSQISENLVQSTINQQLTEKIEQMKASVTSRQSLSTLIQDPHLNLYPEERAKLPLEDVEDQMRSKIAITIAPENLTKRGATVFTIAFSYPRRKEAQQTVQALVSAFINQSKVSERDQQKTLTDFFSDELSQAKADLDKKNETLTTFRKVNEGRLPEQESMNMAALSSLQNQVNNINADLGRLQNDKVNIETNITYLKSELGMTDLLADDSPASISSPVYRQNEELLALNKQIDNDEFQLQQLRQTYKETYPDIRNYVNQIALLKKKRDDLAARQEKERAADAAKPVTEQRKPTNVKMAISRNQIEGDIAKSNALLVNNQHDQEFRRKDLDRLNKEIEAYRTRLKETSVLEAEYADRKRDALVATEKYEKLQHNQDLTRENAELVSRGATEFLEPLDPPTVPQKPNSPNRPLIIGMGIAISLVLGLALAGVQEAKDSSLKNLKDVRAYTNLPVLCSIPLLENTLLVKRKRRITYLAWSAAVIVGILAVGASVVYYLQFVRNT
jgi:succinoglycan biosynthesis transport protein ExoP